MAPEKPDTPSPDAGTTPVPARRSDALEAELAMLEAILPPKTVASTQPAPVDPETDRGGGV